MPKSNRRTLLRGGGLALLGAVAAPAVARAQALRWRMVTSWPKRLPGPGMSAERVAERISALSGGRLQITVQAAGGATRKELRSAAELALRCWPQAPNAKSRQDG